VTKEAEIGVKHPQSEEHEGLLATTRNKEIRKGSYPEPLEGSGSSQHFNFRFPACKIVIE
jgi:hypothetical protein